MPTQKNIIYDKDNILEFGKHRGKMLRQVLIDDPQYILWLNEEEIVNIAEDVIIEAEEKLDND